MIHTYTYTQKQTVAERESKTAHCSVAEGVKWCYAGTASCFPLLTRPTRTSQSSPMFSQNLKFLLYATANNRNSKSKKPEVVSREA